MSWQPRWGSISCPGPEGCPTLSTHTSPELLSPTATPTAALAISPNPASQHATPPIKNKRVSNFGWRRPVRLATLINLLIAVSLRGYRLAPNPPRWRRTSSEPDRNRVAKVVTFGWLLVTCLRLICYQNVRWNGQKPTAGPIPTGACASPDSVSLERGEAGLSGIELVVGHFSYGETQSKLSRDQHDRDQEHHYLPQLTDAGLPFEIGPVTYEAAETRLGRPLREGWPTPSNWRSRPCVRWWSKWGSLAISILLLPAPSCRDRVRRCSRQLLIFVRAGPLLMACGGEVPFEGASRCLDRSSTWWTDLKVKRRPGLALPSGHGAAQSCPQGNR